jgi:type II secretory pathway component PulC
MLRVKMPALTQEQLKEPETEENIEVKPYEFYLNGITGRQIFKNSIASVENAQAGNPLNNVNLDVVKDLTLIGVVQGANLQAIIEDKKNQKTYYVTKGQFVGEFQIEEIYEGKVIINYKGQKFELYL